MSGFADFLGSAASWQLLVLMLFPLAGAVLFAAVLVVVINRRRRKDKETLSDSPLSKEPAPSPSSEDLDTRVLSLHSRTPAPAAETIRTDQPSTSPVHLTNAAQPPPAPATSSITEASPPAELMRLLRHSESGQLIIEVAGRRYSRLADITDKEMGEYIFKVTAHLLRFTRGMLATQSGLKTIQPPQPAELPHPPAAHLASSLPTPVTPEKSPPPAPVKPVPKIARPPVTEPRLASHQPVMMGLNLADEINKIVQARLMLSPLADTTEIDITTDPTGGIRIKVNDTFYSSPDEIPDLQVRNLIKASIKQWERS